jgi:tetratricopeptide (TPR) repeat protein
VREEHPRLFALFDSVPHAFQDEYSDADTTLLGQTSISRRDHSVDEGPNTRLNIMQHIQAISRFVRAVIRFVRRQFGDAENVQAISRFIRAMIHFVRGQFGDAEKLYKEILNHQEQHLGRDHPDTLTTKTHLADVLQAQRRYDDAVKLYEQILPRREEQLGADHPNTLLTMSGLANTYFAQSRFTESEELREKVLELQKRVLGADHPYTLFSMECLAISYEFHRRYDEAEALLGQVLIIKKKRKDPDTLSTVRNLSKLYEAQGRLKDAEMLSVQTASLPPDETNVFDNPSSHPSSPTTKLNQINFVRNIMWGKIEIRRRGIMVVVIFTIVLCYIYASG